MCCRRRPALPHVALPRRFPARPTPSPSASPFPTPPPPAVISSSSVDDPSDFSVLSPLHSSLASSLLSWSPPLARCSPPSPSLLTCSCSWPRLPHACSAVFFLLAAVILLPVSASPLGRPVPSLFLPLYPALLPPSSLGPLRPLVLPRAPLPPDPAANIYRRDKDFGDHTGGVVALWLMAGGYAPRGECPSRPLVIVGDDISHPRFLHRPQQYHPMHYRPTLRHSHAQADGPVV